MSKNNKSPLGIFIEAIGLYFSNFDKFIKYMTFPVLGQIGGLGLVFFLTYFYAKHIPENLGVNVLILLSILITLPGLILFTKAFWEYLVAYGAVNSMLENMLKSGRVYDFEAHTELIKRRTIPFIGLWMLFGIFSLLAMIPLLWVPAGVFAVFFVLVFQVFTYEPELSPIGCVKKSLQLIKGHFASTFMLMTFAGLLTYVFVPQIFNSLFSISRLTACFSNAITPFVEELPISELNSLLAVAYIPPLKIDDIANFVVTTMVAQIVIQYTLPLRSILWGMWYKELNGSIPEQVKSSKARSSKKSRKDEEERPSEKLMKETNKKYSTVDESKKSASSRKKYSAKKLDRNILRRAMEKEEE